MKNYKLEYQDKQGNELQSVIISCLNIKEARKQRDRAFANTKINDVHKIIIIKN
jgi:hypothetical protein